jgi:PAS domain S-box-containing protein
MNVLPLAGEDLRPTVAHGSARRIARPLVAAVAIGLLVSMTVMFWMQYSQLRSLESHAAGSRELVDVNVRVLSQLQREVLRLELLVQSGASGPDLELHRGFVRQRLREADSETAFPHLEQTVEYRERLGKAAAAWYAPEPSLQRLIEGDPTVAPAALLSDLTRMELEVNSIVSWSEVTRREHVGEHAVDMESLLADSRLLLAGQIVVLAGTLSAVGLAARHLVRTRREQQQWAETTAALNVRLALLSEVAARTGSGVLITDGRGVVQWVNDAYCSLVGRTREELYGREAAHPVEINYRELTEAVRSGAASANGDYATEFGIQRSDGRIVWAAVELRSIPDDDGGIRNVVAMVTDLTRHHELQEQLRASAQIAEAATNAKSAFLAAMSHEIRTPLNGMLGLGELLLATPLDPHQRDLALSSQASGEVLLALVNDILTFTAFGEGHIEMEQRRLSLDDIVRATVASLQRHATKAQATVVHQVDPDLSGLHLGDPARLQQVLFNLIGNGIKFAPAGHVMVDVARAGGDEDADDIVIEVRDDGIGIAAHRVGGLFEPFTQAHQGVRVQFGGTGLGLAICKKLVEAMGGTITLDSVEQEGTTVRVELRLPRYRPTITPPVGGPDTPVQQLRVLLVEDDPVNEKVATLMLTRAGIAPAVERDGAAAVATASSREFDLVLMDMNLPVLDGVEATVRILEAVDPVRRPRIVALTANVFADDLRRMMAAGADGVLSKPFRYHDLLAVLEETATAMQTHAAASSDAGAVR